VQDEALTARVGLRIDVDTFRGTRDGVPALLDVLATHGIRATFFFSVGPDNMGRHLWRLLRPTFLVKMIRSNAASLYGLDILLRGLFWPGPNIGRAHGELMRRTADEGHEVGIHAWDHHAWQAKSDHMSESDLDREISRGVDALQGILGSRVSCSASAGWKCNETVLAAKQKYAMRYHSDCRGTSIFVPDVRGETMTPQIPVTLPTYDEIIGRNGVNDDNFNATILDSVRPDQLNVLTIHAEVEGIAKRELFDDFLNAAAARHVRFSPLGDLLEANARIPVGRIRQGSVPGREGNLCVQANARQTYE